MVQVHGGIRLVDGVQGESEVSPAMGVSGELGGYPDLVMQRPKVAMGLVRLDAGERHLAGDATGAQRPLPRSARSYAHILREALGLNFGMTSV